MRKKRGGDRGGWNGPSRGAHGGRGGGGATGPQRGPFNPSAHAMDSSLTVANTFSMQDEARNTTRDRPKWDRDERLRDRPVKFVSAGLIDPLKETQFETPAAAAAAASALNELTAPEDPTVPPTQTTPEPPRTREHETPAPTTGGDLFFVDTSGDKSLRSSDVPKPEPELPSHDSGHETDSSEEVILFKGRSAATRRPAPTTFTVHKMRREIEIVARTQAQRLQAKPASEEQPVPESSALAPSVSSSRNEKAGVADRGVPSFHTILQDSDEDKALKDYMENTEGQEDLFAQHKGFAARDIGGSDGDMAVPAEADSADESDTDADDDADSEDAIAGDGEPADDVSEDDDSPPPDMDDEEIARLLAKQESLGIPGDHLALFDDAAAWSVRSPRSRRKGLQGPRKEDKSIPDNAAAVADVLDDRDLVMDRNRTNPLRKKPKGKHGTAGFDVADEKLRAIMEASFEKDRLKKKERKQEREERRAKGMLGKHPNPDDPRVRFVDGINMDELQQEFASFLITGDQILALPPMDASARKIVHEIAIKLHIKSKSTGKGDQRRPVLHRTKATTTYNAGAIEAAFARVHRRFFPRADKQRRPGLGGGGGGSRSAGGYDAVKCHDGEVVGGSAPELGETNKGRTMLEKMGWSKGMGLGALDNKGILEPVAHIVKVSKAGLG
ncbi:hypothetical protein MAPG_03638 [Magnaporthiopsis poae ATCC 64411]|uniref:Protein SQS1 n=1 Tax=Magnaporthiopsis poae (strain ATCC 64411 / 73-15) TaxID=644358 RepID=A0A0C4DUJ8_MAGP6|nr:hypothetical protein MAPG_03638 [Magnaporthiopsis poae ATCC 64411]